MKNILQCLKCDKEFIDIDEAGEHSRKNKHYEFELKGIQEMELLLA